jgi:hypothetical protein
MGLRSCYGSVTGQSRCRFTIAIDIEHGAELNALARRRSSILAVEPAA